MNNRLRVLIAIEFKRFRLSIKKIDTLRDYVTFFIRDWRSVLVKILDACCGSKMFWFDKENPNVHTWIYADTVIFCAMEENWK